MDTLQRVIKVFENVFEGEVDTGDVTPEASLIEDIGMNSIGMLYMAMALEEEFEIKFNNSDFEQLRTVGDVCSLLESKL